MQRRILQNVFHVFHPSTQAKISIFDIAPDVVFPENIVPIIKSQDFVKKVFLKILLLTL